MIRVLASRPAASGVAALVLVGAATTAAAWAGLPREGVLLAALASGVLAAWVLVLEPARVRRAVHEILREQAQAALRAAGAPSDLPRHTGDVGPEFAATLSRLAAVIPDARRDEAAANLARSTALGVLDGVPAPILGTAASGEVVAANAAASLMLAPRDGRLAGRHLGDLFTQQEVIDLHRAATRGSAGRGEIRWTSPEGVRIVEVCATPWDRGGAPCAVLTFRDITELAAASQLKTDFVANASHEVRTPLSAIKGAVETLADGADEDPAMRRRLVAMIGENARRLEDLTRDLLDLSRLETPEAPPTISTVRPAEIAAVMKAHFAAACAERGVGLEFETAPDAAETATDARLLHLILRNLIENAVKFAYEGTAVRVRAERFDGGVRWGVADEGIGIPLDQQARIFERFYQVDQSRTGNGPRGTGLGLAIVKHAVKLLGGTIRVDSVWKRGTTMTVELPEGRAPR